MKIKPKPLPVDFTQWDESDEDAYQMEAQRISAQMLKDARQTLTSWKPKKPKTKKATK